MSMNITLESINSSTSVETSIPSPNLSAPCSIIRFAGFYLVFIWLAGTILNGSLLYTLITNSRLRQLSTNLLIGSLLLADFIGAFFETPLPAISLIHCRWIFTYASCVLEAAITYFVGCSNMYVLCLISIDRYNIITGSCPTLPTVLRRTYISIVCVYLLSVFWAVVPLFGWSFYDFEGVGISCSVKWIEKSLNVVSYNMTVLVLVYFVPVVIIVVTNIKIYLMLRSRRNANLLTISKSSSRRRYIIERRVLHTITFIIGGYMVSWTPYTIVILLHVFFKMDNIPLILDTIPALFAKSSFLWNPLIFKMRNGNFRPYSNSITSHYRPKKKKSTRETKFSTYPKSAVLSPLTASTPES